MKLSQAQTAFMSVVDGNGVIRKRREADGTVMPYVSERRTVGALVRMGLLQWVEAGKDGYLYNGVVRAIRK